MKMKAGKYYLGDPCYVLNEQNGHDWMDLLSSTNYFGSYDEKEQKYIPAEERQYFHKIGEHFVFVSDTAHGDGQYYDNMGGCYPVDAGMIGCIPLELIPEAGLDILDFGNVVKFDKDFTCESGAHDDGVIRIGNLLIDTDPEPEYDPYDEDDEYDEDEEW